MTPPKKRAKPPEPEAPADKEAESGPKEKGEKKERSTLREWIHSLVTVVAIYAVMSLFLFRTFVITSGSMEGTLLVGDYVLVNKAATGSMLPFIGVRVPGYADVDYGDILVFDPHHVSDMVVVKRVVGLSGDTLEMRGGDLYRNGRAVAEPYARWDPGTRGMASGEFRWQLSHLVGEGGAEYRPTLGDWGPLEVPGGHYFMMGDNRGTSYDSRYWGFLADWRVQGRAARIYFSYNMDSFRAFPWIREVNWERLGKGLRSKDPLAAAEG